MISSNPLHEKWPKHVWRGIMLFAFVAGILIALLGLD
jgi:hypothetical protein